MLGQLLEAKNVNGSLQPLLIVSKVFGLYSNRIWLERTENAILSVLWSVVFNLTVTVYGIYCVQSKYSVIDNVVSQIGDLVEDYLLLVDSFIVTTVVLLMRCKLRTIIERLSAFDKDIQAIGDSVDVSRTYGKTRRTLLLVTSTLTLLMFFHLFMDISFYFSKVSFRSILTEIVVYYVPLAVTTVMVLQFAALALLAKQRFGWINEKLGKVREKWNGKKGDRIGTLFTIKPVFNIRSISPLITKSFLIDEAIDTVESLRKKHYLLVSICDDIHAVYTVPILITTLRVFVSLILNIYFYFKNATSSSQTSYLYSIFTALAAIFINSGQLLILVLASSRTVDEAKLTTQVLHDIHDRPEEFDDYILHFSTQIFHNMVEFTGCRVFVLDETLLFSVVGAITTYLVIIVQFQSGL